MSVGFDPHIHVGGDHPDLFRIAVGIIENDGTRTIGTAILTDHDLEREVRYLAKYVIEALRNVIDMLVGDDPDTEQRHGYMFPHFVFPFIGNTDAICYFIKRWLFHDSGSFWAFPMDASSTYDFMAGVCTCNVCGMYTEAHT